MMIHLDQLGSPSDSAATTEVNPGYAKLRYLFGGDVGPAGSPDGKTIKLRTFNAGYIFSMVIMFACVPFLVAAFALVLGPHNKPGDWVYIPILFAIIAGTLYGMVWGSCVLVNEDRVTVRRFLRKSVLSTAEVVAAEVDETFASLKPVVEIDIQCDDGRTIRTPLVASRSVAGRNSLSQLCRKFNSALPAAS